MDVTAGEAAAQLRADLTMLDSSTKEAAGLLDLAAWQLGELGRQAAPMTNRTLALACAIENIKAARASADEVLEHIDASRRVQGVIEAGPRADQEAFLAALQRLEAALAFLQAHRSMQAASDAVRHTTALRDAGLAAAGAEFAALLAKHGAVPPALLARLRGAAEASGGGGGSSASPSSRAAAAPAFDDAPLGLLPDAVLAKLQALAGAMLQSGSGGGSLCIRVYVDARRGVLAGALEPLLAPLAGSREELAGLAWQQVEAKIPGWAAALRLYVRLLREEARLSAAVFPLGEQAGVLAQVAVGGGAKLLESADTILAVRRAPEKVFGLLDMLGGVDAALPRLRAALAAAGHSRLDRTSVGAGAEGALAQLVQLRGRLAGEARACWGDLPAWIDREVGKGCPADGGLHPVCATTVALLKRALAHDAALPVLFGEGAGSPGAGGGRRGLAEEARLQERAAAAVSRTLDVLLAALEAKARASYSRRALAALHQMNNAAHVCHALGAGREMQAAGEAWLQAHKGAVEEQQRAYVEAAWGPLLAMLAADARQALPPGLSYDKAARQAIKDKFAAVNKAVAEAQAQQGWAVADDALRRRLRGELAAQLVPLYHSFCSKYAGAAYTDHHAKHERFSPGELQALLEKLFEPAEGGSLGLVGRSPSRSPGSSAGLARRLSGTGRN